MRKPCSSSGAGFSSGCSERRPRRPGRVRPGLPSGGPEGRPAAGRRRDLDHQRWRAEQAESSPRTSANAVRFRRRRSEVPMPLTRWTNESSPTGAIATASWLPCVGPITWKDFSAVEKDITNLSDAASAVTHEEVFMTSVSPGTVANFFPNQHYTSRTELPRSTRRHAMSREYKAIDRRRLRPAGWTARTSRYATSGFRTLTVEEFRGVIAENVEVMNHALSGISPSQVRMHVCWGAGETPKNYDMPLRFDRRHPAQGKGGRALLRWRQRPARA